MEKEWKPLEVEGFEERYLINNYGEVKSLKSNKILEPFISNRGYYLIRLHNYDLKITKLFTVHRLVALHFVPNPNNYPIVNHKDENKLNNKADNLEWCTYKYNNNYGIQAKENRTPGYNWVGCYLYNIKTFEEIKIKSGRELFRFLNYKNKTSQKSFDKICWARGYLYSKEQLSEEEIKNKINQKIQEKIKNNP